MEYKILPLTWATYPDLDYGMAAIANEGWDIIAVLHTQEVPNGRETVFICERPMKRKGLRGWFGV